jgi:hypothetical protein
MKEVLKSFVGKPNAGTTKANVTAHIQGLINDWYATRKLEFAPMPTIDVQIDGSVMTVNFYDPETKRPISWDDWINRFSRGNYGRK